MQLLFPTFLTYMFVRRMKVIVQEGIYLRANIVHKLGQGMFLKLVTPLYLKNRYRFQNVPNKYNTESLKIRSSDSIRLSHIVNSF